MPVVVGVEKEINMPLYKKQQQQKKTEEHRNVCASERKSRGHLFVPSCGAKSLTEAILNDIGESLQSEELQVVRGRRGGKKRVNRDKEISMLRKRRKKARHSPSVHVEKQLSHANYLSDHAPRTSPQNSKERWAAYIHVSVSLLVTVIMHTGHMCLCLCLCLSHSATTWLTVPGMCVLAVLWPFGPVVVVLLIFFFLRSSSRCSFCLFCTSISSEMKLFFTCF